MQQKTQNVFTYGSLMFAEVMYSVVKGRDYPTLPATLADYTRRAVKNRVYPGITRSNADSVKGVLYLGVGQGDIQALDYFQGQEYIGTPVNVATDKGALAAVVYVYRNQDNLEEHEWDPQTFAAKQKHYFAHSHLSSKQ